MLTELVPDRAYVYQAPTNSGVILGPSGEAGIDGKKPAIIVDSGIDDTQARKVYRAVEEELGARVMAAFATHAHADHFGGLYWLRKKGVQVMAPPFESAVIENPLVKPLSLFGSAYPPHYMQHKFLYAKPTGVDLVLDPGEHKYFGSEFQVLPLYGHSPGMVGVGVRAQNRKEGAILVVFIGDAVFTREVMEKHNHLPFNVHLAEVFHALDRLEGMADQAQYFVPGHGCILAGGEEFKAALHTYREALEENLDQVLYIIKEQRTASVRNQQKTEQRDTGEGAPRAKEEGMVCVKEGDIVRYMLRIRGVEQLEDKSLFLLLQCTIRANLGYLEDQGYVVSRVEGGELCYYISKAKA